MYNLLFVPFLIFGPQDAVSLSHSFLFEGEIRTRIKPFSYCLLLASLFQSAFFRGLSPIQRRYRHSVVKPDGLLSALYEYHYNLSQEENRGKKVANSSP